MNYKEIKSEYDRFPEFKIKCSDENICQGSLEINKKLKNELMIRRFFVLIVIRGCKMTS